MKNLLVKVLFVSVIMALKKAVSDMDGLGEGTCSRGDIGLVKHMNSPRPISRSRSLNDIHQLMDQKENVHGPKLSSKKSSRLTMLGLPPMVPFCLNCLIVVLAGLKGIYAVKKRQNSRSKKAEAKKKGECRGKRIAVVEQDLDCEEEISQSSVNGAGYFLEAVNKNPYGIGP